MFSHPVQIADLACERDVLGLHAICGSPASPLVVVNEVVRIGQTIELGQEIAMVEIGAAMQDNDWLPLADLARIQIGLADRYSSFVRQRPCRRVCHLCRLTSG